MFRTPTAPVRSLTCTSGFFNQLWGLGFGFKHRVQETACGVQGVGFGFGDVTNVWCSEFRAWVSDLAFEFWAWGFCGVEFCVLGTNYGVSASGVRRSTSSDGRGTRVFRKGEVHALRA